MGVMPSGGTLLVVVDYCSCYYEVAIMHSANSQKIIKELNEMFARFGFLYTLKSDNSPQFVSKEFQKFLEENNIEHQR